MINNKTVLGIIPARGGSKEVPRKNLIRVQGKSLLARTIEVAKKSLYIDRLIVSSEDEEVIQVAHSNGADVPFIRPKELASDNATGVAPILHALDHLPHYDYVVVLQVTSPLRETMDIDHALTYCHAERALACVSVCETSESPYWMFRLKQDHTLDPIISMNIPSQRQALPKTYRINGAIYIALSDWLKKNKNFISSETIGYLMPPEKSLDIDTALDFIIYEYYLNKKTEIA